MYVVTTVYIVKRKNMELVVKNTHTNIRTHM